MPMDNTIFCFCGLPMLKVKTDLYCSRHGKNPKKTDRKKIGKYSGKSNRPYGLYEKY